LLAYLFAFGIAAAGGNNACRVALIVVSAERVKEDNKTVAPTCPVGTVKNEKLPPSKKTAVQHGYPSKTESGLRDSRNSEFIYIHQMDALS
jgi:hypothetical protein